MQEMFFDNWTNIVRTVLMGSAAYTALIFFLRISGKRTLSKMNMFDFIVTVAFGSTLATVILSKEVSLAQGVAGLGLLVVLQFMITYLEVRSPTFMNLVKSKPSLLYFDDQFLMPVMRRERVTKEEIMASFRQRGYGRAEEVQAVILETDGTFSVLNDKTLTKADLAKIGVTVQ